MISIENKLMQLLEKILIQPTTSNNENNNKQVETEIKQNHDASSSYYYDLDKLLTYLTPSQAKENKKNIALFSSILNSTIVTNWLVKTVTENPSWCTNSNGDNNAVSAPPNNHRNMVNNFTLNLVALMSINEQQFIKLNHHHDQFYTKLLSSSASLTAIINLLSVLLDHSAGINWIIDNYNCWNGKLDAGNSNTDDQQYQQFLVKLLEKTYSIEDDKNVCGNIINAIILPLIDNDDNNNKICKIIHLISSILEECLQTDNTEFARKISGIILDDCQLEQVLSKYKENHPNHIVSTTYDFVNIMSIVQFLKLQHNNNLNKYNDNIQTTIINIEEIFTKNLQFKSNNFINVLKYAHSTQYYWHLVSTKNQLLSSTIEDNINRNSNTEFLYELFAMQMLPIFCICIKHCNSNVKENDKHNYCSAMMGEREKYDFRSDFISKLYRQATAKIAKNCYNWKSFLQTQSNLFEINVQNLELMMKSLKYYPRTNAITMFQCLMYCFKDVCLAIKCDDKLKSTLLKNEIGFIILLTEVITMLIEEFEIKWHDSVETICVLGVTFEFLLVATWPTQLVVNALKLINISIAKYMTPNMALLVDRTAGSTLDFMGTMLYDKLHDNESWEIRQATMEVVCTMSAISNKKFPSFQQILLGSNLPLVVTTIAFSDQNGKVKAMALKTLQEMTKINKFWEDTLKNQNLPQKIIDILDNENEQTGARAEAATLMCVLYENQQFTKIETDQMYHSITRCINGLKSNNNKNDGIVTVKVRALHFWNKVIAAHLNHQGMIDGTFPKFTFSKENRKIVNLTDVEIRKRLHKVLGQLSDINCLTVLVQAIQDNNSDVAKTAWDITKKFGDLLKNYNMLEDMRRQSNIRNGSTSTNDTGFYSSSSSSSSSLRSSLVVVKTENGNSKDYSSSSSDEDFALTENDKQSIITTLNNNNNYKTTTTITPIEFLTFVEQDLNLLIGAVNDKKNLQTDRLIEDLESLLDNMLER